MGSLCFCELDFVAHVGCEGWLFSFFAFLEFALIFVINTLLLQKTVRSNSDQHSENIQEAEFHGAGLYFMIVFFIYQALRAILQESIVDLYIAIALALVSALWLTDHIVNKTSYSYENGFFEGMGFFLSIAAWVGFLILAGLAYLSAKQFGYRAWNKVGGLAEQLTVYEVTMSFRAVLRLDIFTVALCSYTAWFYVFKNSGLTGCVIFFVWTLLKDLAMFISIRRGFTRTTRVLRLTSFDVIVALVATLVYDFKWNGSDHIQYIVTTYVAVMGAVIITRVLVVRLAYRSLKEISENRERRETLVTIN